MALSFLMKFCRPRVEMQTELTCPYGRGQVTVSQHPHRPNPSGSPLPKPPFAVTLPVLTCSPEARVSGRWRARTSQPGPPSSSRKDSSKKRLQMRSARGPFTVGGGGCRRKRRVCVRINVCECACVSVKSARSLASATMQMLSSRATS